MHNFSGRLYQIQLSYLSYDARAETAAPSALDHEPELMRHLKNSNIMY